MSNNENAKGRIEGMPEPDPETVKMLEALEEEKRDPDALLLSAMEEVCDMITKTVTEVEEWGASTMQLVEINHSVTELANTAMRMHNCLTAGKTREKLSLMREIEKRNDEKIRNWSERQ